MRYWGIYADSQPAAKLLAVMTRSYKAPEVHGRGYYGHYHDRKHLIHIWYGNPQIKIYDEMLEAYGL